MVTLEPRGPKWRDRAKRTGFQVFQGRRLAEMSEPEIEAAFATLGRVYGYYYGWLDGR